MTKVKQLIGKIFANADIIDSRYNGFNTGSLIGKMYEGISYEELEDINKQLEEIKEESKLRG